MYLGGFNRKRYVPATADAIEKNIAANLMHSRGDKLKTFKRTAIAVGVAHVVLMASSAAHAQTAADKEKAVEAPQTVVVTGQRKALESAQSIKQNAEEIVDSIVAEEAGKLPDRSIAEVLQRVAGVMIDRVGNKGDPQHFSVEGTGVTVRGLSYVRSELNGRDAFSANGGRALSWADVGPELMAGVDVYKNPSAEQIEGGVAGLINLRTALPFDFKGAHASLSLKQSRGKLRGENAPDVSGLVSNRWETSIGKVGALLDISRSENKTRSDAIQAAPYFPRFDIEPGKTLWVPQNGSWRREDYDHTRDGLYGALQWKKGDLDSSLTYFHSEHESKWIEAAQYSTNDPYKSVFSNAKYNDNGVFQSGTISNPINGGVQFFNNSKVMSSTTKTRDLAWALKWRASNSWTMKSDLQFIRANSAAKMATADIGAKLPGMLLDVTGSTPRIGFDDAARAAMVNPANNYWNQMMHSADRNDAKQTAWRGDVQYSFDDPVLRDVRFGVRVTDRKATSRSSFNWAPVVASWEAGDGSWQNVRSLAGLSDPRFAQNVSPVVFNNFFNGNSTMPPTLLVPTPGALENHGPMFENMNNFVDLLCKTTAPCGSKFYTPFTEKTFEDPSNINKQSEQTSAAYATLRFGFDDWRFPVEGNIGLRVVKTKMNASGYMKLNVPTGTTRPAGVPAMTAFAEARDYAQTYTNALPSLNLKMNASKELQFRFAYSLGVSRPEFGLMQAYETLSQNVVMEGEGAAQTLKEVTYTGTSKGNPLLKPTRGTNVDLTAEWYPAKSTSLTMAVFSKELKDIVVQRNFLREVKDDAGAAHNFVLTGPTNGARGTVRGVEVGFQNYFDKLPGLLSGIGVSGNYTYIDSKYDLYNRITGKYCSTLPPDSAQNYDALTNGCDTDGRAIGNLPMPYLSKNAFNLALMYDKGPVSARLAYSWRGRYLQAVNANGYRGNNGTNTNPASPGYLKDQNIGYSLPVFAEDYGTVDAGISYKFNEHLSVSVEGQNLTDKVFKQTIQQHAGTQGIMWFSTGPRYTASLRYTY